MTKADGRRRSTRTIFQCYAPDRVEAKKLRKKLIDDFPGAKCAWGSRMKNWVLVFNDNQGLPPSVVHVLDGLRAEHPDVTIDVWTEPQLRLLLDEMTLTDLVALFGAPPSSGDLEALTVDDILPLIAELEGMEPAPGEEPLTPPPVDKLRRNNLSADAVNLLLAGRRKQMLVDLYFRTTPRPDAGERIAEGFRRRYKSLRNSARSPDSIFDQMRHYAGFGHSSRRQIASLAVLSYFFERCDIFEDPEQEP